MLSDLATWGSLGTLQGDDLAGHRVEVIATDCSHAGMLDRMREDL